MKKNIQQITTQQNTLTLKEQENVKGGILIYCEEKRIKFLGKETTVTKWNIANDNSLFLRIKM